MKTYPRNPTVDLFEDMTRFLIDTPERPSACASCPFAAWRVISPVIHSITQYNKPVISSSADMVLACHCTHLNVETMRSTWAETRTVWAQQNPAEVVTLCSARELEIAALAEAAEEQP